MQNKGTMFQAGQQFVDIRMPGKDREIGEMVELGKNIGSTKVIYEHFIGLRVPADIILSILPITIRGSGRGSATGGTFSPASPLSGSRLSSFERRSAAIGAFGDRLIAPSAIYDL